MVASGAIERAQAMNATWPDGSLANVSSPIARPSSSTAHAASVALWVSMPIAVIVTSPCARMDAGRKGSGAFRDTLL